jgi:hypothetical protein
MFGSREPPARENVFLSHPDMAVMRAAESRRVTAEPNMHCTEQRQEAQSDVSFDLRSALPCPNA